MAAMGCQFIFSNDGRWIVAASMDSVVRVWDMPTGHLIDIFQFTNELSGLEVNHTDREVITTEGD
jgi:U3 small nucleolar RNA-associated protein 21